MHIGMKEVWVCMISSEVVGVGIASSFASDEAKESKAETASS